MRAVGVFAAVLAGAVAIAQLAADERWLGDQPGIVVVAYALVTFVAASVLADARSPRHRAINAARRQHAQHRLADPGVVQPGGRRRSAHSSKPS